MPRLNRTIIQRARMGCGAWRPIILGEATIADVTFYVALPFGVGDDGLEPGEASECTSANAAIRSAERMARTEGPHRRRCIQSYW